MDEVFQLPTALIPNAVAAHRYMGFAISSSIAEVYHRRPWYDCGRDRDSPADYLCEGLTPAQLVEADLGSDGRILSVAGAESRATRTGYWVDGRGDGVGSHTKSFIF